jgi:hypothetical protein
VLCRTAWWCGGPGVAGGFLHVPQRNPGVESGGDQGVAERAGGPTRLAIAAPLAIRRTVRPAAWRSIRLSLDPTKFGP